MKEIQWEFYVNPLKFDEHESLQQKIADIEDEEDDEFDDLPYNKKHKLKSSKSIPLLMTSFGIIPMTDELMSNKTFKLWVGHTNFTITLEDAAKISKVPGVEAVKFFSQYRFLICVGRLFSTAQVKVDIQTALCTDAIGGTQQDENLVLDSSTQDKVNNLKLEMSDKDNWYIYVLPNGKILSGSSDDYTDEFDRNVRLVTITFKLVGGALFGS